MTDFKQTLAKIDGEAEKAQNRASQARTKRDEALTNDMIHFAADYQRQAEAAEEERNRWLALGDRLSYLHRGETEEGTEG